MPDNKPAAVEHRDYFQLNNPLTNFVSRVSYSARKKMFARFMEVASPAETDTILDIGVTPNISQIESNYFEQFYPWTQNITMASVEDAINLEPKFIGAKYVQVVSGQPLPFGDKQFDIVFSSAVIEHVGAREEQKKFLEECLRVGKKLYLTTPNKKFPIEVHTYLPLVHLLPQKTHQRILSFLGFKFYSKTDNLNLLTAETLASLIDGPYNYSIYFNKLLGMKSNIMLYVET